MCVQVLLPATGLLGVVLCVQVLLPATRLVYCVLGASDHLQKAVSDRQGHRVLLQAQRVRGKGLLLWWHWVECTAGTYAVVAGCWLQRLPAVQAVVNLEGQLLSVSACVCTGVGTCGQQGCCWMLG